MAPYDKRALEKNDCATFKKGSTTFFVASGILQMDSTLHHCARSNVSVQACHQGRGLVAAKLFVFGLERMESGRNTAMVTSISFSPGSVQFKSEINDAFPCKRHQKRHLEFCIAHLRSRGLGVQVPPGAPHYLGSARHNRQRAEAQDTPGKSRQPTGLCRSSG